MTTSRKTTAAAVKKTSKSTAGTAKVAVQPGEEAKAAVAKKAAAPKSAGAEKSVKKTVRPKTATARPVPTQTLQPPTLTPEQRRMYVEVAAYYIAERRGFHGGSELEDWLQAEAEIDRLFREGILKP